MRVARPELSRFKFSEIATDSVGNAYLEDREPFGYVERDDNIPHVVEGGDTLASLAQFYYWYLDNDAAQFWWVIAEFQPVPINNPFRPLVPGRLLILPAPEFLESEILTGSVEALP